MATLTEAAFYSRKYIKLGIIAFVAFIILRLLFGAFLDFLRSSFPTTIKANNAFGKLPAIAFPQSASPSAEISFTLQTITGTIPEASSTARVFFMPKERINLLSLSKAQTFIENLGFTTSPRQITDTLYRWIDIQNPLRTVELDIVSYKLHLTYLYQHDLTLFTTRKIPDQREAISQSIAFLRKLRLNNADLDTNFPRVEYLKLVGNMLQPSTSQSQADAISINFFRRKYDGFPLVTDTPTKSNVSIIMSGNQAEEKKFLELNYNYWPVENSSPAIYKLKTSETAWREFLDGKAYIAQLPKDNLTNVAITDIYLAYYDGSISQFYLQPVFVIKGDGDFFAYVPAVAAPWIETAQTTPAVLEQPTQQ